MVFLPAPPEHHLNAHKPLPTPHVAPPSIVRTLENPPLQLPSLAKALRLPSIATSADIPVENRIQALQDKIAEYSGGRVVFDREKLSEGAYYDKLPSLSLERQERAAEIALRELQKYPRGFFEKLGLTTFGIFEACISNTNDGFHAYDPLHEGYRWYGLYNFKHGAVGAYYSDAQLPLTIHHEIFHAVDAHYRGDKGMAHYESDNVAFARALQGEAQYPRLALSPTTLTDLKRVAKGVVLRESVSDYTTKSPDEDQAETARHFMMNIADSLIQATERPELPGSQRILHILTQYRECVERGPTVEWFAAIALGKTPDEKLSIPPPPEDQPARDNAPDIKKLPPPEESPETLLRSLATTITNEKKAFIVRGSAPDPFQPNPTLQGDIRNFARTAGTLREIQRATNGRYSAHEDLHELVGLLDAYEGFVTLNFKVSKSTKEIFGRTRNEILQLLPESSRRPLASRLLNHHYLSKVDRAVHSAFALHPHIKRISHNIRMAQPAVVLIDRASGFNINAEGTILTNAHVAKELHRTMKVQFPNGDTFDGECTHIDEEMDLALVKVNNPDRKLPFVRFSPIEAEIGTDIVVIGQPDTYDNWHVSTGKILNYHPHPHIAEEGHPLGGIEHNGWTFWGNSGSPLLNLDGLVVGAHNTYDAKRNMRCGVRYEPIISFLKRSKVLFEFGQSAPQR